VNPLATPRSPRSVLPGLFIILLAALSCSSPDPIPSRLLERLKSAAGVDKNLTPDEVEQALTREMRSVPVPAKGAAHQPGKVFPTRETLATFYEQNGNRLAWCDDAGKVLPSATTLLETLRRAGDHGLEPEDYALSRLDGLREKIGKGDLDDEAVARLADFDLLMTAAFFRYASDLSTGRLHPDEIRDDWHTSSPELDPLTGLGEVRESGKLAELLDALPPPHAEYAGLCKALKELRQVEAAGGWPVIPEGPKLVQGSRGPRVAVLRQRLAEPAGDLFDVSLAGALKRAQQQHGIEPDGKLGAATLAELNVPVERRIGQVELNIERWRWVPRTLADPYVVVNIPGFDLALMRGGTVAWRTRVVVGKSFTPTPVFSDRIVAVVANPPWNVPESIAVNEYLPELKKDAKSLRRHGLRLLKGPEEHPDEINPASVNWDKLDDGKFPYRIRQDPGPDNALGRLKFQLTNDFGVYLHDTPARSLFGHSDRDLSHGCIRVENPLELARLLLDESSQDLLREALGQPDEKHVAVKPPVPIHILYLTAWVDDAGALHFGPDVYEFDGPQRNALDRVASRVKEATPPAAP
jgi:murein L,D-transpeptidase YcbB/YkuD